MDTQIAQGSLNELRGQIKKTWGKLTDDDLSRLEGSGDELVGKVQRAYGYTRERAQQEFDNFKRSNPHLFRDNRGTYNQETRMSSPQFNTDTSSLKNRASNMLEEDIVEPAQQYWKKAREYGSSVMDRGSVVIRENPGYSIAGAVAVGFLLGAYFSRRRT